MEQGLLFGGYGQTSSSISIQSSLTKIAIEEGLEPVLQSINNLDM